MTDQSRPGRCSTAEVRRSLAAPADAGDFTSGYASASGLRLHIRQRVPAVAGGPPMVLIHGLAVSHRYLMPTAEALASRTGLAASPILVPDLPGFGLSDKPRRVLTAEQHADVLAQWLAGSGHTDLTPACVLANSYGCQVAVELAVRHPQLVGQLVLVGPTVDPAARTEFGQLRRWLWTVRREDPRQAPILLADVRDAGLRRVFGTLRDSVRHPMHRRLPLVRQPVLLMRGQYDSIAPQSWLDEAARLVPDPAGVVTVPSAAHNAITTAGPEVAATVDAVNLDPGRRSRP